MRSIDKMNEINWLPWGLHSHSHFKFKISLCLERFQWTSPSSCTLQVFNRYSTQLSSISILRAPDDNGLVHWKRSSHTEILNFKWERQWRNHGNHLIFFHFSYFIAHCNNISITTFNFIVQFEFQILNNTSLFVVYVFIKILCMK